MYSENTEIAALSVTAVRQRATSLVAAAGVTSFPLEKEEREKKKKQEKLAN